MATIDLSESNSLAVICEGTKVRKSRKGGCCKADLLAEGVFASALPWKTGESCLLFLNLLYLDYVTTGGLALVVADHVEKFIVGGMGFLVP